MNVVDLPSTTYNDANLSPKNLARLALSSDETGTHGINVDDLAFAAMLYDPRPTFDGTNAMVDAPVNFTAYRGKYLGKRCTSDSLRTVDNGGSYKNYADLWVGDYWCLDEDSSYNERFRVGDFGNAPFLYTGNRVSPYNNIVIVSDGRSITSTMAWGYTNTGTAHITPYCESQIYDALHNDGYSATSSFRAQVASVFEDERIDVVSTKKIRDPGSYSISGSTVIPQDYSDKAVTYLLPSQGLLYGVDVSSPRSILGVAQQTYGLHGQMALFRLNPNLIRPPMFNTSNGYHWLSDFAGPGEYYGTAGLQSWGWRVCMMYYGYLSTITEDNRGYVRPIFSIAATD